MGLAEKVDFCLLSFIGLLGEGKKVEAGGV